MWTQLAAASSLTTSEDVSSVTEEANTKYYNVLRALALIGRTRLPHAFGDFDPSPEVLKAPGSSQIAWWARGIPAGDGAREELKADIRRWSGFVREYSERSRIPGPQAVPGVLPVFDMPQLNWGWNLTPMRDADSKVAASRVSEALNFLRENCPPAALIVEMNAQIVVLRQATEEPDGICSASNVHLVGMVMLANTASSDVSVFSVADRLVHESLHSLMYKIAYSAAPASAAVARDSGRSLISNVGGDAVVSPWSGRPLTVMNYVHACFVWATLSSLWGSTSINGVAGTEKLKRTADSGFLKGHLLGPIPLASRGALSAEVLDALDLLSSR